MPKQKPTGMERRAIPLNLASIETRSEGDGEEKKRFITGYAAVFYDGTEETELRIGDWYIERIMPGAFDRALNEKDDVRGLFNHDSNHILGRTASETLILSVDQRGLKYEIEPPDTQSGRDVLVSLERGDLSGSSFAFIVEESIWRDTEDDTMIREIENVRLFDVGPVTYPAYEATESEVAKRSLDNFLKQQGFPKRDLLVRKLRIAELIS